jgi:hypothetical protein
VFRNVTRRLVVGTLDSVPDSFTFDDRVSVRQNERTRAAGTAGRSGTIAGMSREPDEPTGRVVAYAVAMDDDERVWMVEPGDLDPA